MQYKNDMKFEMLQLASALEWDFTAQVLWCAAGPLRGNAGYW